MGERRERADAGRNRRAILPAAEELIAGHGFDHVSLDRFAAAGLVAAVTARGGAARLPASVRGPAEAILHAPAPETASTEAALV